MDMIHKLGIVHNAEVDWKDDYERGQVKTPTIEEAKEWYGYNDEEAKIYVDAYLACLP